MGYITAHSRLIIVHRYANCLHNYL